MQLCHTGAVRGETYEKAIDYLKAALQSKRTELARAIRSQSTQLIVCEGRARCPRSDAEHPQPRGNGHVSEYTDPYPRRRG